MITCPPVTADLALDTAVRKLSEAGAYASTLPASWDYAAPSGGVLMTVALRAMAAEIGDPSFQPLSATATFCSPILAGPMRTNVTILRRGNAAVQVRGQLAADPAAGAGLEVCATFARDRKGGLHPGDAPPPVPRPADAPALQDAARRSRRPMPPFFFNFEWRAAGPRAYWEPGGVADETRFTRWVRYLVPQRLGDGSIDPLAIPPLADTMPPAVAQRLGPGHTPFDAPSLDLTVHFLAPASGDWLLVSTRARHARVGYASAEVEIWDEGGRLVAFGAQTMILRERASR
jgi:acyl-CoA thioesterase